MTDKDISFEKAKGIFNSNKGKYTDDEIKEMKIFLTNFARIYYDWYIRENEKRTWKDVISKMEERKDEKVIKDLYT
jgi:predicted acetyltransferase